MLFTLCCHFAEMLETSAKAGGTERRHKREEGAETDPTWAGMVATFTRMRKEMERMKVG